VTDIVEAVHRLCANQPRGRGDRARVPARELVHIDDEPVIAESKADFTAIYDQPDPRAYFRTLGALDYQIPQQSMPVIRAVLGAAQRAGRPAAVLDLCCSYGINAALLRCDVELDEIIERYSQSELADLTPAELAAADAEFFSTHRRTPDVPVIGLDLSAPAIDYACRAGLLTDGWAENLETDEPSPSLVAGLGTVGLVICTGGVGYVGRPAFQRLLEAVDEPAELWLAVFVLRVFCYDDIVDTLAGHGLVTEKVPGLTVRQRRFADRSEYDAALHALELLGIDPTGKETDGWYHAECFVTRPAALAAAMPLRELLAGVLEG